MKSAGIDNFPWSIWWALESNVVISHLLQNLGLFLTWSLNRMALILWSAHLIRHYSKRNDSHVNKQAFKGDHFLVCVFVLLNAELSLRQRVKDKFGLQKLFFLHARKTFGWNVTNTGSMSQDFHWLHFSLMRHSRKSWLKGHETDLYVYPSPEVKNLKHLVVHLKINL